MTWIKFWIDVRSILNQFAANGVILIGNNQYLDPFIIININLNATSELKKVLARNTLSDCSVRLYILLLHSSCIS